MQNEAEDTGGAQVDTNEGRSGGNGANKRRRKRDRLRKALKDALGTFAAPVAPRVRVRLSKKRPEGSGELELLQEEPKDEQSPMASGALPASSAL